MMENAKDVLPEDNEKAVEKVKQENYAFFMESSSIEYISFCVAFFYGDLSSQYMHVQLQVFFLYPDTKSNENVT